MDTLYRILAMPLSWFYQISGSYIVAMILYGILIKVVLFPFGVKQQKGMIRQAQMRPKEMAIRKRYAGRDDRKTQMKMQEDLQKLYTDEGYNPMSGCGPMLIQLPVIFILYRIIYEPLKYIAGATADLCTALAAKAGEIMGTTYSASSQVNFLDVINNNFDSFRDIEGFGEIFADQAAYSKFFEGFKVFGVNLTRNPSAILEEIKGGVGENIVEIIVLLAIPVLVFVSQYVSMKVVRKFSYQPVQDAQTASSMKMMDISMPLMTLFMAFMFPGLLGIYWIVNSLLSMVQQILLKKLYPIPVFTEEDYKAAEKEMSGKLKPAKKAKTEKKRNPKSLHHIDDDDDEEEPSVSESAKEKPKANPFIEPAPEKKDSDDTEGN